jgi:beta-lactamase superfamily II metal-dependent hydrolase
MSISYEIDFLPVDSAQRTGDAICIRYGSPGDYRVLVYDGGTKASGVALVKHIRAEYGTNTVDDVVCSHPDLDHLGGLSIILQNMEVRSLWMHRPWMHSPALGRYVRDGRIADQRLAARMPPIAAAYALETMAARKGVALREPFQGDVLGEFTVLSPDRDWYVRRLAEEFDGAPPVVAPVPSGLLQKAAASARQAARCAGRYAAESLGAETLGDEARTSFENDSSVVLFGTPADRGVLLTGDAGVRALTDAADFADARGIAIRDVLKFMQIPRHGNSQNVSTAILDRLIGPKRDTQAAGRRITAFASTTKQSDAYPHRVVVNAFIRRGAKVVATNGTHNCHHFNIDTRIGWRTVIPMPFWWEVDTQV